MNYLDQSLESFLDSVASGEPTPGGGAAAAVVVALAAGLACMTANLSDGHLTSATELTERAEYLRQRIAPLAQEDAAAYVRVLAAYRAPENGDYREHIRTALSSATDIPLAIAETGAEVAEVAAQLARDGNPKLRGDAIAATLLAKAGVQAAAVLVEINMSAGEISDSRLRRAEEFAARAVQAVASLRSAPESRE